MTDVSVLQQDFDVEDILRQLTIDEKVSLISGADFWHTVSIPRLGLKAIRFSDGPNGIRGTKFFNSVPAACFPCGTSTAASWDTAFVTKAAELMGKEAIAKGVSVILGPTTNMHRGPLGGRGFESFSEDPMLAGAITSAVISGIQSTGVAATPKHFICNDQEDERMSCSSVVSERALREIYLLPFQIAVRDSKPMCIMTSYNRLNGLHCSENPRLLKNILRDKWRFDGLIMSDWFGTYSTSEAIKAGLDIEMPGPSMLRGQQVKLALASGKLHSHDLDNCVYNLLNLVKRTIRLGIPERATENGIDTPETAATLRAASVNGIVLLKNDDDTLPFSPEKTTAVIGPNANFAAIHGGGSASLNAYYAISPLEGIRNVVHNAKYRLGAKGWKKLPFMSRMTMTGDGRQGLNMRVYLEPPSVEGRKAVDEIYIREGECVLADYMHPDIATNSFWVTCTGDLTPEETSEYEFSCSVAGTGKIFVDGEVVVDNETNQTPGDSFFGAGTGEEIGVVGLEAGKTYSIRFEFATMPFMKFKTAGATSFGAGGFRLGCERKINAKTELDRAIELAKSVDQVVLVCGLNADWESEGYDRADMNLPPGSDELISAVLGANKNTVIVNQSGTPVSMPWRHEGKAILQAWYGGNETGNAIADVIFGKVNPSGKLPLSFPIRNEDNPAYLNFKSNRGRMIYGEDVYVGYRYYEATGKNVAFPFGHGLSYTSFKIDNLRIETINEEVVIKVDVENTGNTKGSQVVQVYVQQEKPSVTRPGKELKGFSKVEVEVGQTKTAEIRLLKKYATSFWDEDRDAWISEQGRYIALVGDSSANTPLQGDFEVSRTTWWNGL